MSELINNSKFRKERLKELILKLHAGKSPEKVPKHLEKDQIPKIIAPFIPAPLLDKTLSLGYLHWVEDAGDGSFRVYLTN